MKALKLHDLGEEDLLRLTFDGAFNPHAPVEHELEPFFAALEAHAGEWMPDVVAGKRRRKYTRASLWKALDEEREDVTTNLGLYRTAWPALDMSLWLWFPPRTARLDLAVSLKPLSFFVEEERCRRVVEMVRAWARRYPVTHAAAHSADDKECMDSPNFGRDDATQRRDGFDKIYEVFWLNVFGPKLVATVGRERMLSTPAHRVEELPDGSVLLVLWPTPAGFASDEAREAQARAHVHLRPDLDFDTVLRALRERSAQLAPVEPRFAPELAPLLTRVVDGVASHKRSRTIAELNAWRPPEPEEWLPSQVALPPDLAQEPTRFRGLAEYLVALLHIGAPSVHEATPESLTDVDFFFWREEFPTSRPREAIEQYAIPAVGAYLGEVLVRHLGGQWIARQKLEECQVRVGSRVWLPFVRARRYMESRQALLDFSLTQLYREAERHRG